MGYAAFSSVPATFDYLPGTSGWTSSFADQRAVLWNPHIVTADGTFGVNSGQFGFTLMGAADVPVAVEACTDLVDPNWTLVTNLMCDAEGKTQFTDLAAADQPSRYHRFRPE